MKYSSGFFEDGTYIGKIKLEINPATGKYVNEQWRSVIGYVDCYKVSNYGRVISLPRFETIKRPRILKPSNVKGYKSVILSKDNKIKRFSVHRLVCTAFKKNPKNLPMINHIDTIKTNNFSWNLEWCTGQHNMDHAKNNGLIVSGESNHRSKFSNVQISEMRSMKEAGYTSTEIKDKFNINRSWLHHIIKNKGRKNG